MFLLSGIVLYGRLKVYVVTLLSAASFVIVSAGGSHIVWLSIFGQLTVSMLPVIVFAVCVRIHRCIDWNGMDWLKKMW